MAGKINIKLIRSSIGRSEKQKQTVKGLGLRKLNQIRTLDDTPEIRGMVNKINHLVRVLD
ncbi:MAG: 50S ribosomal protein L30 [Proteobacteria bacterium]|nr:50S ribosomal protein L30 [Pseudomonadota bacterium]